MRTKTKQANMYYKRTDIKHERTQKNESKHENNKRKQTGARTRKQTRKHKGQQSNVHQQS